MKKNDSSYDYYHSYYMLYMYQGTMHEKPEGIIRNIAELKGKELAAVVPIALLTIYIGLHPASIPTTSTHQQKNS